MGRCRIVSSHQIQMPNKSLLSAVSGCRVTLILNCRAKVDLGSARLAIIRAGGRKILAGQGFGHYYETGNGYEGQTAAAGID